VNPNDMGNPPAGFRLYNRAVLGFARAYGQPKLKGPF